MKVALLAIIGVLAGDAAEAASACTSAPGKSGLVTIDVTASRRAFIVRLPRDSSAQSPRPVVVAFHAFGVGARLMEARVNISRVWPEAIVVYPEGLPRDGPNGDGAQPAWQRTAGQLNDRDIHFFDAMLEWLRANHCIDEAAVHVMGYSNGAMFANLLACQRPGVIAGVAAAAGDLPCAPTRPVPVILSHGVRDVTVSYQRGLGAAQRWSQQNGCSQPPPSGTAGCSPADRCSKAPVVLCTYNGGHEYDDRFTSEMVRFFRKDSR